MTTQYSAYTNNICPNGSFENDPTGPLTPAGWSTVTGQESVYVQAYGAALPQYGNQCLQVNTPGLVAGEGVFGPSSVFFTTSATGSMTVGLRGQTGNLIITAMANPDGIALASQTVQLDDEFNYVTVTLNGLAINNATEIYILIQTVGAESLEFFVDGVMYEPESPAHPYIDGSFPGCTWGTLPNSGPIAGTPFAGPSYQQFQNSFTAITGFTFGGSVNFIDVGETFTWPMEVTEFEFSDDGSDPAWVLEQPIAAMTDFALFNPGLLTIADPDPAMTYGLWNNASVATGSGVYTNPYAMVVPPNDYFTSNGNKAWNRAAYMGVGFQFLSLGAGKSQVITDVQLEYAKINSPNATPNNASNAVTYSSYQRPRQLQVIIKPNRLNYISNPSFETNVTTGWTAVGSGALSHVGGAAWNVATTYSSGAYVTYNGYTYVSNVSSNTGNPPTGLVSNNTDWNYYAPGPPQNVATYQNLDYSPGSYLCKLTVSAVGDGLQLSVPYLIPGETYIVSAYVYASNQLADILISCGGNTGDVLGSDSGPDWVSSADAIPYGGAATEFLPATPYGSGPYGGIETNSATPLPQQWFRISVVFTAGADTETLKLISVPITSASLPTVFYVDAVLCELGDALLPYFDGNSGPDAMWLTGGTANLCQSFYYESFEYGQHVVTDALAANTPMGISYATPLYATMPTQ